MKRISQFVTNSLSNMVKNRRKKPERKKTSKYWKKKNNFLSDSLVYTGDAVSVKTRINLLAYDAEEAVSKQYEKVEEAVGTIDNNKISWIHVTGLNDTEKIHTLCKHFKIGLLHVKDILNSEHLAKVDVVDEQYIFLVLDAFSYHSDLSLQHEHVTLILGNNYVISFQESDSPIFDNIRNAVEQNSMSIRSRTADYLFCSLIANVTDNYRRLIEDIQDGLEEIETKLLNLDSKGGDLTYQIQDYRISYRQLRRAIFPIYDDFRLLLRTDSTLIHPENQYFLLDIKDHLTQAYQTVNACRENLSTLMDLYFAGNDLKMNDIMKRLTVVATIFIPLTFLVGVWGMNFRFMPELSWKYGYLYAWALLVAVGIFTWLYLRKRRWF
ncbi:MAG: magnesium/cobalt transporter CorA [Candidatus Azobacteroides sp.]|nr:magnesium/cobalt transporter CorA [Candidatus Azobacteroides sp.]